jgi:hypothetical protein
MSYDLCIRHDDQYSRGTPKEPLTAFMRTLPGLQPNGPSGFAQDDPPDRWMQIYLEVVAPDGNNIEEDGVEYPEVNCIRLYVPYGFYREESFEREYLPTALAIARHLGWTLVDLQTEETLEPPDEP